MTRTWEALGLPENYEDRFKQIEDEVDSLSTREIVEWIMYAFESVRVRSQEA